MTLSRHIYRLLAVVVSAGLVAGCLDINEDPNNPTTTQKELLLPSIQEDIATSFGTSIGGLSKPAAAAVHYGYERGSYVDYSISGQDFELITSWRILYAGGLQDIEGLIELADADQSWHYKGIALTLKAYTLGLMVDTWAQIPFSEAFQGAAQLQPNYDEGADIYPQLQEMLDSAMANLDRETAAVAPGSDDLVYGGDLEQWKRLANSLKIKLYNHTRLVGSVAADVNAALANDVLTAGDDFEVAYGTAVEPENRNPGFQDEYASGPRTYPSPYFYEIMLGENSFFEEEKNLYSGIVDPRVPYYFYRQLEPGEEAQNEPTAYRNNGFVSIPGFSLESGPGVAADQSNSQAMLGLYCIGGAYDDGGAFDWDEDEISTYPQLPQRLFTYFQMQFTLAELALTEGVTAAGDARALFEEGIRASFAKVNEIAGDAGAPEIEGEDIDAYVAAVLDLYDAADNNGKLQHIMTQKWIASFGFAVDAWTDYRRTGFPLIHDGNTDDFDFTVRTREYPLSFPWPQGELQLNANSPSQKIPGNNSSKVFWDN